MAWDEEMVAILRPMIWDIDESAYTYSDERLAKLLLVAGRYVVEELEFAITISVVDETMEPDPTDEDTRDDSFINLTCLKACCYLDRGQASLAAPNTIMVRDGGTTVDLRDVSKARIALIDKGWCKVYDETVEQYLINTSPVVGAAIMSPFRLYARSHYPYSHIRY